MTLTLWICVRSYTGLTENYKKKHTKFHQIYSQTCTLLFTECVELQYLLFVLALCIFIYFVLFCVLFFSRYRIYRNQAEMSQTCRGTISLHSALIHTVDSSTFVITNGGTQTFHIKAGNEVERQNWVTALELAKAKSM